MGGVSAERVRGQVDALAGAGLDWATFGHAALETLRRALPHSAACLATIDPASLLITDTIKTGALDSNHDDRWSYHEYEHEDVYDFRGIVRRRGDVITLNDATRGDRRRSSRFSELFAPVWDFSDELRVGLRADGVNWGVLALFHSDGRTFTAAEQDFVSGVVGSLGRGLRSGVVTASASAGLVDSAPDGPGVLVLDTDNEVVQANPNAAARVADLGGGPLGDAPLPQLVATLAAAARRQDSGDVTAPRGRMRTRGGRWVVAHASPLARRDDTGTDVVVTIDDARPPEIIPLVVASYGLTDRERDVVALVLQGVDTADVARRLHLSAYTVQDHLKKIFDKVDVRSRRELIARVFNDHYVPRMTDGSTLAPSGWYASPAYAS